LHFLGIGQAIAISVGFDRGGAILVELIVVAEAVAIAVSHKRIGLELEVLVAVADAVAIAVGKFPVGAKFFFELVTQTVFVCVTVIGAAIGQADQKAVVAVLGVFAGDHIFHVILHCDVITAADFESGLFADLELKAETKGKHLGHLVAGIIKSEHPGGLFELVPQRADTSIEVGIEGFKLERADQHAKVDRHQMGFVAITLEDACVNTQFALQKAGAQAIAYECARQGTDLGIRKRLFKICVACNGADADTALPTLSLILSRSGYNEQAANNPRYHQQNAVLFHSRFLLGLKC